jgi:hypothetical protein
VLRHSVQLVYAALTVVVIFSGKFVGCQCNNVHPILKMTDSHTHYRLTKLQNKLKHLEITYFMSSSLTLLKNKLQLVFALCKFFQVDTIFG